MNIDFLKKYPFFKNKKLDNLTLLENQGYCNTNYKLTVSKQDYLIRVFTKNELDRKFEFKVAHKAYKKNIGEKPLFLDTDNYLMVSVFTHGKHKYNLEKEDIRLLAKALKKLHSIKIYKKPFDLQKVYKTYSKEPLKKKLFQTNQTFKKIRKFKKEYVLCHHDLNPKNILFNKKTIKLIDWEYAAINDRYFDIASIVEEFSFSTKDESIFLNTYFTCKDKPNYEKLRTYKAIYQVLCKLWFYTQKQN